MYPPLFLQQIRAIPFFKKALKIRFAIYKIKFSFHLTKFPWGKFKGPFLVSKMHFFSGRHKIY